MRILQSVRTAAGAGLPAPLKQRMMRRIHVNYRAILGINGSLIAAGVTGLIQPTTSALLHNTTTLALSLRSMSWKVPGEAGQE